VALKELLNGMNTLHQAGKFKQLGLSNFLPDEVEEVIRIAKEHNYVLPSVYQGNYNAVSRHAETRLLPILRKHEISYYAYSPIAGGFLTKDVAQFASGAEGRGRWDPHDAVGAIYNSMYGGPGLLNGLRLWGKIAEDSGIPKAELAYRWVAYHSALDAARGDSMIFGSRNVQQIRGTLAGLRKGPLPGKIVEQIEMIWNMVEDNAPVDNFNHFNSK
jgi:aryl-alcohol dehydrogenase-like predicted oxidoreductase